ncbi:MAG: spermidine synthase [Proteobacteria bacterium]|nr:MAG: spermidine synthase [Pseudomonadota bacterium]PIE40218.1 MAG: spermidine synthase [Gammaproteobacteria bacterium]
MQPQPRPDRFFAFLLGFCMFSTGASGLVNEYVLATITTYILGNSIEQFSLVIASMMLMMGVSGLVQNRMSDDALVYRFIGIEVLVALLGGFAPLAIYAAYGYLHHHFLFVHYFFVLMVGFLIGFEIPVVMRIIEQNRIRLKANLVIVYAMDYIGAFVGAVVWVTWLLKHYPLTEISFIVAGFNFIVAVFAVFYYIMRKDQKHNILVFSVIILTACALLYGYIHNRELSDLMEQRFYDDPIVHRETTRYQHLVVTKNPGTGDVRLYINGNTQFSSLDENRYHDFLVHPVMALAKRKSNVLLLGGGDGLALRELNKYADVEHISLVDLDPDMVKLAATEPNLAMLNDNAFRDERVRFIAGEGVTPADIRPVLLAGDNSFNAGHPGTEHADSEWVASIHVINVDADRFLDGVSGRKWDVVIVDFPDPSSVELSKLYSKQFYRKLARHLSPDALVAIQSTSPYHAKEAFLAIGATLRAAEYKVIPYRQNIPSFGDWGFFLAWRSEVTEKTRVQAIKEVDHFDVETTFITPELMVASLAFGKGELHSSAPCINTLMHPCLVQHYNEYSWIIE